MSEWKEEVVNGQQWWSNEELGTVTKLGDDIYVAMLPKIIKLGPFENAEDAKKALSSNGQELSQVLEQFNHSVVTKAQRTK